MTSEGYRELRVWQSAMKLAEAVYSASRAFPASETYGMTSQLRRAAVSVPANIAEGRSRDHTPDYLRYLSIARGSLAETETLLELAARFGYLPSDQHRELMSLAASTGRQLLALRKSMAEARS